MFPLAARLGQKPITTFAVGQETELAAAIVSQAGVILICWEHEAITAKLLSAILQGQQIEGVPHEWDDARYDLVLRLDRVSSKPSWSLRQLFPCLLSGDSDTPMR